METKNNALIVGLIALILGLVIGYFVGVGRGDHWMMSGDMPGQGNMMMGNIDRHFIEQMIPHHDGAIAMAELALKKSARPEIKTLSEGIIEAQTKENKQMREWYKNWFGTDVSENSGGMGMMNMRGMEGDLTALQNAKDFDQEFLSQMIVHHEMAVMMAQMLKSSTDRPEMKGLAENIISSQTREITQMHEWQKSWFNQ